MLAVASPWPIVVPRGRFPPLSLAEMGASGRAMNPSSNSATVCFRRRYHAPGPRGSLPPLTGDALVGSPAARASLAMPGADAASARATREQRARIGAILPHGHRFGSRPHTLAPGYIHLTLALGAGAADSTGAGGAVGEGAGAAAPPGSSATRLRVALSA